MVSTSVATCGAATGEAPDQLDAVHAGQVEVHHGDVGGRALHERHGLLRRPRLPDHGDVGLGFEPHPQPEAERRVVLDEQHLDRLGHRGTRTRTTVPWPSGGAPMWTSPPISTARSRIDEVPMPSVAPARPRPSSSTTSSRSCSSR
jgi:hypothetical protein